MRVICFIMATVGLVTAANAEFLMVSPPAAETGDNLAPPPTTPMRHRPKPHPEIRPPARDPALNGFGNQVPLSFAVRQIVPAPYQVAFAESVDKAVPVDWKGGKPWRAALSDAIRPLGLTVSVAGAAVTIKTAKSTP